MSNASLRKFPVTAPDGTEFRVTIREGEDDYSVKYAFVNIYGKRKRFGYRKVHYRNFINGDGIYSRTDPNYIEIVTFAIEDYYRTRRRTEQRRQDAAQRFAEWDGRLAE